MSVSASALRWHAVRVSPDTGALAALSAVSTCAPATGSSSTVPTTIPSNVVASDTPRFS